MKYLRKQHSNEFLISLYRGLLLPRLIEEKMLILLRQGKISKWFSGIGQEAISVGSTLALEKDEYILPMHRNLGVFTSRNIPLDKLFCQFQGKPHGFTNGRDRSFHFGSKEHHIVGMISHLGPQLAVADGIALANKLNKENKVSLVFTGDGGTSEGDFHEALNVAATWDLPVLFVIENNGYALSTPSEQQYKFKHFIDKAIGYGMKAVQVDGNNVLEVYDTISKLSDEIRKNNKPVLIEAITFRMRGHEEASGNKYVPKEIVEKWSKKDPLTNFELFLLKEQVINQEIVRDIRKKYNHAIEIGLEKANQQPFPTANTKKEISAMYALSDYQLVNLTNESKSKTRFVDAISSALELSMNLHQNLILMGQDIADYGGVFKITDGFLKKFGEDRIRNTPLCESAILGIGLGLSIANKKSVIEMQFADFITSGFNQVVNNLAKSYYRWGQPSDVVIRMPTGAGVAAGPFHSQSNEAWFVHTPGLKVVYPSTVHDAKGLLCSSINDPNPILYFEHKFLYRSLEEEIYDDYYTIEIGKANLIQEGTQISIITYGMGVHWAIQTVKKLGVSVDILDLRTLLPWDKDAVKKTVTKTGKILVLHEDCLTGGFGGEVVAWISEHCFESLDAPLIRVASLDTAVPFSPILEENFLPKSRLEQKILELIEY